MLNISKWITNYESLSPKNKEKVFNEVVDNILKVACEQEEEEKRKICNSEGHVFGKWKIRTWTTKELYWDAGPQGYFNVKHKDWKRKCERCGYIEKAEEEPQELIDERKEKNKKMRIQKLEKTLYSSNIFCASFIISVTNNILLNDSE